MDQLISLLLENPNYIVQETVEEYDDMVEREPEVVDGKTKRVAIAGNLVSLVENLDNEVNLLDRLLLPKLIRAVHKDSATYRRTREGVRIH